MHLLALIMAMLLGAVSPVSTDPQDDEAATWALARKIDTMSGYVAYLRRYAAGAHRGEALAAFDRLHGGPVLTPPPAPPAVPLPVPPPAPPGWVDPCTAMLAAARTGTDSSAEAQAYLAVRRSNRLEAYRAFAARYPASVCGFRVAATLARRRLRRPTVPGFGPLPAHRLAPVEFEMDDYPAAAVRAEEQGRVSVAWDVAEDGEVEACHVAVSSGSETLDTATCAMMTLRMRYDPARDASGAVTRGSDHLSVLWQLPPEAPRPRR